MGEAVLKLQPLSEEAYLSAERCSALKHEYVDGQVYALAGAADRHNLISMNIAGYLWGASRGGPCRVYSSDMKVRVQNDLTSRFYYPDVMVTCDPDDTEDYFKVSPCLIAEILSPSTQGTDRREKLFAYQSVPSLNYYLIVEPDERFVELYRRDAQGWWYHEFREDGVLKLECPKLELSLAQIYEGL